MQAPRKGTSTITVVDRRGTEAAVEQLPPLWNSGSREAPTFNRELQILERRRRALDRANERVRRRYGTNWPAGVLNAYCSRGRDLEREYELLYRGQWQPTGSCALVGSRRVLRPVASRSRSDCAPRLSSNRDNLEGDRSSSFGCR